MSAPIADEVLRELGARVRVFHSLKHAVRWFDGLGGSGYDLGTPSGGPRSRESIDTEHATHAALLCCFRARDMGIDDEDLSNLLGPTLDFVCGYYSLVHLADRAGLSEQGLTRWVARGERVLRGRLYARGMLARRVDCECGCGMRQEA